MPGGRGRGGRRTGQVGKAYPQRSDLNGGPLPKAAATGQAYGAAKAQTDAQSAVPMGTPQVPPAGAAFTGRPESMPAPGSLGGLFDDSTNPGEHVMNGATLGPGLGPAQVGIDPEGQMRKEDLDAMAVWVPMIQEIANRTGGSPQSRQWLRTILGAGGGR
jgi:hypothetical protein